MLRHAERQRRPGRSSFLFLALVFAISNVVFLLYIYTARSSDHSPSFHQQLHAPLLSPLDDRDNDDAFVPPRSDAALQIERLSAAGRTAPASDDGRRQQQPPLPSWIRGYIDFHRRPATNATRYLIWTCTTAMLCGGIGDRARGIVTSFYLALITGRKLLIRNPDPVELGDVLRPADVDWATMATAMAPLASWEYESLDHINEAPLVDFVLRESPRHRVVTVRSNYIIWPMIMNDVRLAEPRNNLKLPHGDSSQAWNEMLFNWAWKALMLPSDALRQDIDSLRQTTGLDGDFIAVHIRRGGHWGDPLRYHGDGLLEKFADCLQNMTTIAGNDLPVFVSSDDFAAKKDFAELAPLVVFDNTTQPFHVERTERDDGVVDRNRRAWAEYYLLSQSLCAIACGSGFSIWPVVMSRDTATGARCFARLERCSRDNIQRSLHGFVPVRI